MIKRNKFRTIVTILGVIGCTVLLISGVGLYEQMGETKDWYFNDVNHFESKLIIDEGTNLTQINSVAQKVNGTPIMESSIEIVKDQTELRSLLVWKDSDLITLTDDNHDKIKLGNDEVSVSQKMADKMNISVGDTIDARLVGSDKNIKIKVDKIHSSPFSQGLVMSPDKLNELGLNYTPTSIISAQHVTDSYAGINSILYLNDLMDGWDQLENISMMIISALVVFGVMMALVILYNLNILSYTEMENDIVTLKTLGFKSAYLTKILATQSLFFIIIGFIIGVPVGYYVLSIFMPAFGEDIYLVPSISATNIIITFMIIMAVSVIMIVFFSHKIKKFDMVNSLKFYQ
jgi:putative ABC transport system permease protein